MRTRILLAIGCAALLSACATATPYQAASENARGFAEQQIEDTRYRISFSGNSLTDLETVENYMLYRAAELTTQRGFDYFVIADRDTEKKERFVADSTFGFGSSLHSRFHSRNYFHWNFHRSGFRSSFRPRYGFGYSGNNFSLRQVTRYQVSAEIVMGRGEKPQDNEQAFDARNTLAHLADTIIRPEV